MAQTSTTPTAPQQREGTIKKKKPSGTQTPPIYLDPNQSNDTASKPEMQPNSGPYIGKPAAPQTGGVMTQAPVPDVQSAQNAFLQRWNSMNHPQGAVQGGGQFSGGMPSLRRMPAPQGPQGPSGPIMGGHSGFKPPQQPMPPQMGGQMGQKPMEQGMPFDPKAPTMYQGQGKPQMNGPKLEPNPSQFGETPQQPNYSQMINVGMGGGQAGNARGPLGQGMEYRPHGGQRPIGGGMQAGLPQIGLQGGFPTSGSQGAMDPTQHAQMTMGLGPYAQQGNDPREMYRRQLMGMM